ncbi:MAG: DUF192 domain-containing protein [Acidimicrobiales bacterium]|nr:DUF192 domain-containing protein [Acidimicrobiales bacterium]
MPAPDPFLDRPAWLPRWLSVDDVRTMRWLRRALVAVFAAGLSACVTEGADRPADPELGGDPTVSTAPDDGGGVSALADRFGTIVVDLVTASGELLELCLLDADQPAERTQGLKGVTDLGDQDGMLFRWEEPTRGNFVMIDTVTPLTISWWDADGSFVSSTDMEPCTEADDADCARYGADGAYEYAVEVFQGELPEAGAGARLEPRIGSSCHTP